ncbi:34341_t:CDS:1, partial [Gigaspora margarita]
SKNMSLSPYSESSDEHRNSLIETEPFQIDTMPLSVEDNASQNMSDKSDLEDHKDVSFNTFHELET